MSSDDNDRAKAEFALNEPRHERYTEKLDDGRDKSGIPYDQLQIGDPVFYWPEGVDAVVDGYEWTKGNVLPVNERWTDVTPQRVVAYKLSVGITVSREHLMRRQTLPSAVKKMPDDLVELLEPFGERYRQLAVALRDDIRAMPTEQLEKIAPACWIANKRNCGWMIYGVAQLMRGEAAAELGRRK